MNGVTTLAIGQRAEQAAAEYLVRQGYEVLEQNYRRPHCEIDIVARLDGCVYFVEVKYRGRGNWGSGLDYISPGKLHHMQRAAVTWVRERRWNGPYTLSAIEVGGPNYEVLGHVESIY